MFVACSGRLSFRAVSGRTGTFLHRIYGREILGSAKSQEGPEAQSQEGRDAADDDAPVTSLSEDDLCR